LAEAKVGLPGETPTIATALKAMGYATGQFGKAILATAMSTCRPCMASTNSGSYLYHLDAMEDPFYPGYPPSLKDMVGPRNLLHTWATNTDDPTVDPRWGKVGKQKIED
jgi:arylsulfatase A-like enzyme